MCGFWVELNGDDPGRAMLAIHRRGPDDEGRLHHVCRAGPLFLGHRRLAIYDPDPRSTQPMQRGALSIVLNGAIYNFRDLRRELEAGGARFTTQGDTEVFLAAWNAWGPDALGRFEGMFAAAVLDADSQSLWLMRDRFGEKPLYWGLNTRAGRTHLAAGSSLLQFRSAGGIDEIRLGEFINQGRYHHDARTLIRDVRLLPPGQVMRIELGHELARATEPVRFVPAWQRVREAEAGSVDARDSDFHSTALRLRTAIQDSVRLRLTADVPVGACLSGGVDSGLIVALASSRERPLQCFTALPHPADLDDPDQDESKLAAMSAAAHGAQWHPVRIGPADLPRLLASASFAQDGPLASTSVLAQQAVFEAASGAGIRVMLDGQAADELFCGYSGVLGPWLADQIAKVGPFRAARDVAEFGVTNRWKLLLATVIPAELRAAAARARNSRTERLRLALTDWHELDPPRAPGQTRLDAMTEALVRSHSLPGLLAWEDNSAMHHGIETRLPYLHTDVIDLASRVPPDYLLRGGQTKALLREAARGLVPDAILDRRKKVAFAAPTTRWLFGAARDWFLDGLAMAPDTLAGVIDAKRLRALPASPDLDASSLAVLFRTASASHWVALKRGP